MGTVHRPLAAASRGPVWALAAAAALLLLWLSSSGSGGGSGRGTALQLLAPWSPAARASGVAFCTSQEAAAQAAKFTSALQKEGLFTACPHHKWLSLLPGAWWDAADHLAAWWYPMTVWQAPQVLCAGGAARHAASTPSALLRVATHPRTLSRRRARAGAGLYDAGRRLQQGL